MFDQNIADESVIYIDSHSEYVYKALTINASDFTNNVGVCVCVFLSRCRLTLVRNVSFKNNTADNGGALYIDEASAVNIGDGAYISFVNNSAILYRGAIFVELNFGCNQNHTTFDL